MTQDPYKVLGLGRAASQEDVRRAYHRLARQYHPDHNPGDAEAEERFKAVGRANAVLGDARQRARFDRGEIDGIGQERPHYAHAGARGGHARGGRPYGRDARSAEDLGAFFSDIFNQNDFTRREADSQGVNRSYTLDVSFEDAVLGATRRLGLPDGHALDVHVPPGVEDGQVLRLRGKGAPGRHGGAPGDALITLHVAETRRYRRDGRDLAVTVPVDLETAILGGKVAVETPRGKVSVTVPKRSDSGTKLRLAGRGVSAHGSEAAGDLYAELQLRIGEPDAELIAFLEERAKR